MSKQPNGGRIDKNSTKILASLSYQTIISKYSDKKRGLSCSPVVCFLLMNILRIWAFGIPVMLQDGLVNGDPVMTDPGLCSWSKGPACPLFVCISPS